MDLSTVKMIVSDMDGTLLDDRSNLSDSFEGIFRRLQKHNILFVAASGRQYRSIYEKFGPMRQEIAIIAENGGFIKQGDEELGSIHLSRDSILGMLPGLRTIRGANTVLCGKNSAYIERAEPRFLSILGEYYTKYDVVSEFSEAMLDDFYKVAIHHFESSERFIYPAVKHLEDTLQVKVSGEKWVDISDPGANKGNALKVLQEKHGIKQEETMVFGDFNNDLEMLDRAYFSFAMENAHENVKRKARFSTKSNNDRGVEFILEKLLAQRS